MELIQLDQVFGIVNEPILYATWQLSKLNNWDIYDCPLEKSKYLVRALVLPRRGLMLLIIRVDANIVTLLMDQYIMVQTRFSEFV